MYTHSQTPRMQAPQIEQLQPSLRSVLVQSGKNLSRQMVPPSNPSVRARYRVNEAFEAPLLPPLSSARRLASEVALSSDFDR
mmetsp:Transcript_35459/g.52065  ORF Transcript_35459/g.52065 Transcript_35459/m.52065 type:complete len:82 (+) Transcript_35459:578-823(+)